MINHPTKVDAINSLGYGDYSFTVENSDHGINATVKWDVVPGPITDEQINAKYLELLALVPAQNNKAKATELLSATDWVNQPDVIDSAKNPHLLNQADFLSYREALRQIAVNPPSTEVTDWPTLPTEVWS